MAQSIEELKTTVRGQVIQQKDAAYDAARRVYNGMIDKRPKLIVRAVDVGDVMAAVRYGRESGLLTAIRGGGHNGAGLGTCDGGLWRPLVDCGRPLASAPFTHSEGIEIQGFGDFHQGHYRGKSPMRRSKSAKRASDRSASNCGSMASSVICVSPSAKAFSRFSKALAFSPRWA